MHTPRYQSLRYRVLMAAQRDFGYTIRLLRRLDALGNRFSSGNIVSLVHLCRLDLLRFYSQSLKQETGTAWSYVQPGRHDLRA